MLTMILDSLGDSKKKLDVIFIMGSSDPSGENLFDQQKFMVKEIMKANEPVDIQYGIIQNGERSEIRAGIARFKDIPDFMRLIDSLKWDGDAEELKRSLQKANKLFEEEGRPTSRKVLVVFTNGRVPDEQRELEEGVKPLKEKQVKIIPVVMKGSVDPKTKILIPDGKDPLEDPTEGRLNEEIQKGLLFILKVYSFLVRVIWFKISATQRNTFFFDKHNYNKTITNVR